MRSLAGSTVRPTCTLVLTFVGRVFTCYKYTVVVVIPMPQTADAAQRAEIALQAFQLYRSTTTVRSYSTYKKSMDDFLKQQGVELSTHNFDVIEMTKTYVEYLIHQRGLVSTQGVRNYVSFFHKCLIETRGAVSARNDGMAAKEFEVAIAWGFSRLRLKVTLSDSRHLADYRSGFLRQCRQHRLVYSTTER